MAQQVARKYQEGVLALLREIPQPGEIFLNLTEDGVSGFLLRPKTIPPKLPVGDFSAGFGIALQILNPDGKVFYDQGRISLDFLSDRWRTWLAKQKTFAVRQEDVGQQTEVILDREKNFNRNLLHEFLDRFKITLKISPDHKQVLRDSDAYPMYFWRNPVNVAGNHSSSEMGSIKILVSGLDSIRAISIQGNLWCKWHDLVSPEKRVMLDVVIKWHKALISLYHLMKRDGVEIPVDFEALKKACLDEIESVEASDQKSFKPESISLN